MDDSLFAVPAALLWATVAWRWRSVRRGFSQRALWLALIALAATATLGIPAVERAVQAATPAQPNAAYLAKHVLVIAVAATARELLRQVTLSPEQGRRGAVRRVSGAGLVAVVLIGLFLAAPVGEAVATADFTARYGSEPLLQVFYATFLAYLGAVLSSTIRLTWRYGRQAPAGGLRTGILLICAGSASCLGYVLTKGMHLFLPVAAARDWWSQLYANATLGMLLLAMVLIAAGCAWPALAGSPAADQLRAWRRLRNLRPLWSLLAEATPSIALPDPGTASGRHVPMLDQQVRLYRRVIEIRDGLLALHPYAPPDLRGKARAAAVALGVPPEQSEALADAVWVEVARRAKAGGRKPDFETAADAEGAVDVDGEAEILERVSAALRQSALVRAVAARLEEQAATSEATG